MSSSTSSLDLDFNFDKSHGTPSKQFDHLKDASNSTTTTNTKFKHFYSSSSSSSSSVPQSAVVSSDDEATSKDLVKGRNTIQRLKKKKTDIDKKLGPIHSDSSGGNSKLILPSSLRKMEKEMFATKRRLFNGEDDKHYRSQRSGNGDGDGIANHNKDQDADSDDSFITDMISTRSVRNSSKGPSSCAIYSDSSVSSSTEDIHNSKWFFISFIFNRV